jgi:hypothetical protein
MSYGQSYTLSIFFFYFYIRTTVRGAESATFGTCELQPIMGGML